MTLAQILLLPASANPRIIKASDNGFAYHIAAGAIGATAKVITTSPESVQEALAEEQLEARQALLLDDGNGNIPADGILLSDSSGVALAGGVFAWNATLGQIVRHNGVTVGGVPVDNYSVSHTREQLVAVSGATMTTGAAETLHTFPMTADQMSAGSTFRFSGKITLFSPGIRPASIYLGIATDDDIINADPSFLFGFENTGSTVGLTVYDFIIDIIVFDNGGGLYQLSLFSSGCVESKNTGATFSMSLGAVHQGGISTGLLDTAQDLKLRIQSAPEASAGGVVIAFDVKLEQIA